MRRVVAACVVLAGAIHAASPVLASGDHVDELRKLMPLRVRDMGFPGVMLLGFAPAPSRTLTEGMWLVEAQYEHSSNFMMSDNMQEYLDQRTATGPLDETDIAALEGMGEEFYYFDGEIGRFDLIVHYGLSRRFEIVASAGYVTYTGGELDGLIGNFHDLFDIDPNGRDLMPSDLFQGTFVGIFGKTQTLDSSPGGGFTDPTIRLRWGGTDLGGGWQLGLEAAGKLSLGDGECYHTSGSSDAGLRLALQRGWERTGLILNAYYIAAGNLDQMAGFEQSDPIGISAAYIRTFGRTFSLNLQVLAQRNLFDGVTDSSLAEPEFQLSAGFTARVSERSLLQFSYTNNLINYDNTPDLVFQVGLMSFID